MSRRSRLVVAAPLAMLLAGGAAGWFLSGSGDSAGPNGTVVGRPLPSGDALDTAAPVGDTSPASGPLTVDRRALIGYPADTGAEVPRGSVIPLALDLTGSLTAVDAATLRPSGAPAAASSAPAEPQPLAEVTAPPAPPSTLALPDATTPPTSPVRGGGFVDPCTTQAEPCTGGAGDVVAPATPAPRQPAPLRMSLPFAATGAYASMCAGIEGGTVPDAFLTPPNRPTVAVVVNQPATIALTGTWDDGTPLDKFTMVTSADFDQQWKSAWEGGEQRSLLACVTLPLDLVRQHAQAGRADLAAGLLAISATGRLALDGPVTLTVPLDDQDPVFAEPPVFASLGEQAQVDGSLAPTVHVHYAVLSDALLPASGPFARSGKVYGQHAFVENADCAGWSDNAQGLDRTRDGVFSLALEQRTVAGRPRPVAVVDGDLVLDPSLPGGWNGFVCVKLFADDGAGNRVTIALRGAAVRSPRTATYDVGVLLTDPDFPDGWSLDATWTRADATAWCGPATLTAATPGATCATYARAAPAGVRLVLRATDDTGAARPSFVYTVPVSAAYCNTDDVYASLGDGCGTGYVGRLRVPVDTSGDRSVVVTVQVVRRAGAGSVVNNPSHAWQIDATRSFAF